MNFLFHNDYYFKLLVTRLATTDGTDSNHECARIAITDDTDSNHEWQGCQCASFSSEVLLF